MLGIALAGAVILLLGAIELGFIPPPTARVVIRLRHGTVDLERGQLSGRTLDHVAAILRDHGIREGYIAISGPNRIAFSRLIPGQVHQQLRNVLLNPMR